MARRVCVDFDGVLNIYSGWQGEDELFEPRPGAGEFLHALQQRGYEVVIFTTRSSHSVWDWLGENEIAGFVYDVTNIKVPALVYIDDRAVRFNGDFYEALCAVDGFRTHWESKVWRKT